MSKWELKGAAESALLIDCEQEQETRLLQMPHEVAEEFLRPLPRLFAQLHNGRLALLRHAMVTKKIEAARGS